MSKGYKIVSGQLRHRLDVLKVVETIDEIGAVTISHEKECAIWGSIVNLKGSELIEARQVFPTVTAMIRIRYFEGLSERDLIEFNGNRYNIDFINNIDERNKVLELSVTQNKGVFGDNSIN